MVLSTAALADDAIELRQKKVDEILKGRDPTLAVVLEFGQYYHRHDHLVVDSVISITPEEALRRGYARCPDCLPQVRTRPASPAEPGATAPRFYKTYLTERVNPTAGPPGGAGGGSGGGGGGGGSFGSGIGSGVVGGYSTAAQIGGAYSGAFVR
jgi:uncharacterized membrane protein YgcG